MSAQAMLASLAEQVRGLFPALNRIRIRSQADGGALAIGSASGKVEVAGGGRPASGVGHFVCRLYRDTVTGIVYASESLAAPYSWTAIASGAGAPTSVTAGTAVHINEGSGKVQIDG